ncbi:TniQ family protein [Streptomyces agglomeratus]|uniref:TniQ family protein n=1 Tax=Streptomyces agglomeratus TaxID=285458 RepID=UPI0009A05F40|nr:TniQ family protein [Streptomyces agglomeratus]
MTGTPLPRSLDPAQGELLAGYLLRLAHRIGISPLGLAHRCGLTAGTTFPTHHLVRLDSNQARQTATVCRLALPEVHALTLATQAPSYPPLHPVYLGRHQSQIDMANDGWVFTAFSRYCPACLADTAGLPGGSVWQGSWRLPHIFLCTRHHRLLDWRCPDCQAPAFSNGYRADGRWRPTQLTPSPRSRLHPAQCRHRPGTGRDPACAQRLDHPSAAGEGPTEAMVHAQQRLSAAARSVAGQQVESLGGPTSPQRFLNDVRAATLAICSTWPATAEALTGTEHLDAVAAHVETLSRAPAERAGAQGDGWLARSVDHPPGDPLRAAALMALVVRILDDPDGQTVLASVLSRLPSSRAGYRRLKRLAPHCSSGMNTAIDESTHLRHGTVGPPALFPQPPSHQGLIDPKNIPQHLPDAWAWPLDELNGPATQLRRDAAIRLVQMTRGGSRAAAARYLGITPGALQSATVSIRAWQKMPANADAYQDALQRIAEIAAAAEAPSSTRLTDPDDMTVGP